MFKDKLPTQTQTRKTGLHRLIWITAISLVLVLAIILALVFFLSGSMSVRGIERPAYP